MVNDAIPDNKIDSISSSTAPNLTNAQSYLDKIAYTSMDLPKLFFPTYYKLHKETEYISN